MRSGALHGAPETSSSPAEYSRVSPQISSRRECAPPPLKPFRPSVQELHLAPVFRHESGVGEVSPRAGRRSCGLDWEPIPSRPRKTMSATTAGIPEVGKLALSSGSQPSFWEWYHPIVRPFARASPSPELPVAPRNASPSRMPVLEVLMGRSLPIHSPPRPSASGKARMIPGAYASGESRFSAEVAAGACEVSLGSSCLGSLHPQKDHFELLLKGSLVIDSHELIALLLVNQVVG